MTRRARVRALGGAALAAVLVLGGCAGDDEGGSEDQAPVSATSDGDVATDEAPQTAAVPTAPPTEAASIRPEPGDRSAGGGTTVVVEGDRAAFVLPSGNVACTLNAVTAVCEVDERSFTPQGDHLVDGIIGDCSVDQANAIMINDGPGAWTCVEDAIKPQAWVAAGGWWAKENDSETVKIGRNTMAVLPYGSSISVGPVSCSASDEGVRCSNGDTGRSFSLSRGGYQYG
jgi:hypothetical protein